MSVIRNRVVISSFFLNAITEDMVTWKTYPLKEVNYVLNVGVKAEVLQEFANLVKWDLSFIAKVIGVTKQSLIKNKNQRLNKLASEQVIEIAKLIDFGTDYFGSIDNFNDWLGVSHIRLNGQPPRAFIDTIRGRELIKELINGLKYGFCS